MADLPRRDTGGRPVNPAPPGGGPSASPAKPGYRVAVFGAGGRTGRLIVVEERTDTVARHEVVVVDLAWRTRGGRGGDGRAVGERVGLLSLTTVRSGGRWQFALGHNVDCTNAFDRMTDGPDRAVASSTPGTSGKVAVTGNSETSS